MPVIFQALPGSAVRLQSPVGIRTPRAASTLFSFGSERPSEDAITTGISFSQRVAAQFRTSLRRILYVFPFGDEPSELTVNLTLFNYDCEGNYLPAVPDVLNYYEKVKLGPNNEEPMDLVIGGTPIKAFCISMDLTMEQVALQIATTARLSFIGWNLSQ